MQDAKLRQKASADLLEKLWTGRLTLPAGKRQARKFAEKRGTDTPTHRFAPNSGGHAV